MRNLRWMAACVFACVVGTVANAADLFVPDDHPTIQAAINASASGDTITVRAGTYNERLSFGARNIVLKSELGAAATIIDPQGAGGYVVTIDNPGASGFTIEGFTIRNGLDSGIYVSGVAGSVRSCRFINNQASQGGAMYMRLGADVAVSNCEFLQNLANRAEFRGGACFVDASVANFTGCLFSGNQARRPNQGFGNASYIQRGGGVCALNSTVTLTDCVSSENVAFMNYENGGSCFTGSSHFLSYGGFVSVSGGSMTVQRHVSSDDEAYVRVVDTAGQCGDRLAYADPRGGFAHVDAGATLELQDCSIHRAEARSVGRGGCCFYNDVYPRGYGGVIFAAGGAVVVERCQFVAPMVVRIWEGGSGGPQEASGGCIYRESGSLSLIDVTVEGASAPDFGGVIRAVGSGEISLSGTRFENCVSGNNGGAISAGVAATMTVTDTEFVNCRTDASSGGAIWLTGGTRTFTGCTFTGNIAQGGGDHRGGAIHAEGGAQLDFTDCGFTANEARSSGDGADRTTWGGACAMFGVTPRFTRCTFTGNASIASGNGGGWRRARAGAVAAYDSDTIFTDCVFDGNRAETLGSGARLSHGGTVHLWSSDSDFIRTSIIDGQVLPLDTEAFGGGVFMENNSRPGFAYSAITDCDANRGAGVAIYGSEPYFIGTALRRNAVSGEGGAMYVDGSSTPYILECAFEQNAAGQTGGAVRTAGSGTNVPFIVNSSFCGNSPESIAGAILGGAGNTDSPECANDCNGNGMPDAEDIAAGTSSDANANAIPDECETDCNANGVPDAYELGQNAVADCNGNGTPDGCDIADATSADADASGVPDECELESARLVPFEYGSITAAINAAVNGDTIFVAPGAYYEKFSFGSKKITLRSVGGAEVTYIDGNSQNGTLLTVNGAQGAETVIDGFTFWYAQGGHALRVQNASPTVRNCRFLFNNHSEGSALRIESPSSARIEDCLVESNTGTNGAGLWSNTTPLLERTVFRNNVTSDDGAGARLVGGTPSFIDCTFDANRCQGGGDHRGGAVCATDTNNLSFLRCEFTGNIAMSNGDNADRFGLGGAVALVNCIRSGATPPVMFDACIFSGNIARTSGNGGGTRYAYGGAIHDVNSDVSCRVTNFMDNLAEATSNAARRSWGGAIYASQSNPDLDSCTFVGNTALSSGGGESHGGALCYETASNGTIEDCTFDGNDAGRGGALYLVGNSQPNLRTNLFEGNSAFDTGGAIHANASPCFVFASDFRLNAAPTASAISGEGATGPNIFGCTFCGNQGVDLGGSYVFEQSTISELCDDCNGNLVDDAEDILTGTSADCDANGVPDECDADADGDGVIDACDGCPSDPLKADPGSCGCGVSDTDSDGDGTPDCLDGCPSDPAKTEPGACGCGVADTDSDGDGTPDCLDGCPTDPNKTDPGACGCGVADTDSDGDGTPDCLDGCPTDPNKTDPGACGCGVADTDSDDDGTPDCLDGCPSDPAKTDPGACGCGVVDLDSDGDGEPDCTDNCPSVANAGQEDCDDDGVGDACTAFVDCDGNGTLDACDIASGAADVDSDGVLDSCETDCDANGLPDDFEIALDPSADCDGDSVLDGCQIASGQALDSDGDGLLDVCESDCDGNGIDDDLQLSFGFGTDCDANGVLDWCQDGSVREAAEVAPWGGGAPLLLERTGLAEPTGDVLLMLEVVGDLEAVNEFATLQVNGSTIASLFGVGGSACGGVNRHARTIPRAQWLALAPLGDVVVSVAAPVTVGAGECASSWARVTIAYQDAGSDCDLDGVSTWCEIASGTQSDCDGDRLADECSVAEGVVADCDGNGIPDSCDIDAGIADCDLDGIPDACAVAQGLVADCDLNGIPDSCDLTDPSLDCDQSGALDACEIASGAVTDCDGNGVPDGCDLAAGAADCNTNGVPDACDIASGASSDVDANGVPDECKADCNGNGLPDAYELAEQLAPDCDANGIIDSCDIALGAPDCNGNGVPDACDIAGGTSTDIDSDLVPDECAADCNGNGVPDAYEVAKGLVPDCDANGLPDACDLAAGASDCDANGVIDSCDVAAGATDDNANQVPDDCEFARGDFDLDGAIGGQDLAILLSLWGLPDPPIGDLDGDGQIGGADLAILLGNWG